MKLIQRSKKQYKSGLLTLQIHYTNALLKVVMNRIVELLYQQSELFDDHPSHFDEKIATYKINDNIYIKFDSGIILLSGMNYERI
jgi:hypothetical protein